MGFWVFFNNKKIVFFYKKNISEANESHYTFLASGFPEFQSSSLLNSSISSTHVQINLLYSSRLHFWSSISLLVSCNLYLINFALKYAHFLLIFSVKNYSNQPALSFLCSESQCSTSLTVPSSSLNARSA